MASIYGNREMLSNNNLGVSRSIFNFDQIQSMRRRGRSGFGPVARFEQFTERLRRAQTRDQLPPSVPTMLRTMWRRNAVASMV